MKRSAHDDGPGAPLHALERAAKIGLQQGDIVLTVEKKEIRTRQELYQEMWKKRPGERISLRILRDDQSFDVEVIGGDRADRYRT